MKSRCLISAATVRERFFTPSPECSGNHLLTLAAQIGLLKQLLRRPGSRKHALGIQPEWTGTAASAREHRAVPRLDELPPILLPAPRHLVRHDGHTIMTRSPST